MALHKIERESITKKVYEELEKQIVDGAWKPGERLPSETELANSMGVSRTTVRNALQRLSTLGLIETKLGDGSYVKKVNVGDQFKAVLLPNVYMQPHSIQEVLEFRCAIEIQTAGIAASKATRDDVRKLRKIFLSQQDEKCSDTEYAKRDLDFHYEIAKIARNSLITATYDILRNLLTTTMINTVHSLGKEIGLPYHQQLIVAMSENDSEKAIRIMKAHMQSTYDSFEERINANGSYANSKK